MCQLFTETNQKLDLNRYYQIINNKKNPIIPSNRAKRDVLKGAAGGLSIEDDRRVESIVDKLYDEVTENGRTMTYRKKQFNDTTTDKQQVTSGRRFNFAPGELEGYANKLSNLKDEETNKKINADTEFAFVPWPKKWKHGIVPFFIDSKTYDEALSELLLKAFDYFEKATCIRLQRLREKPIDNKSLQGVEWLYITNPSGIQQCVHSNEKLENKGVQMVVFGYDCMKQGEILHEIMHVLGFSHEHTRPDRDEHVSILWDNIKPGYKKYFEARSEDLLMNLPYDHLSVLHYPPRAFSKNGQPTILAEPELKVGQRDGLSETDVEKIGIVFGYECVNRDRHYLLQTCPTVVKSKYEAPANISFADIEDYFESRLWPLGIVNYLIKDPVEFSIEERENIQAVIRHIEKETCIEFRDLESAQKDIEEEESSEETTTNSELKLDQQVEETTISQGEQSLNVAAVNSENQDQPGQISQQSEIEPVEDAVPVAKEESVVTLEPVAQSELVAEVPLVEEEPVAESESVDKVEPVTKLEPASELPVSEKILVTEVEPVAKSEPKVTELPKAEEKSDVEAEPVAESDLVSEPASKTKLLLEEKPVMETQNTSLLDSETPKTLIVNETFKEIMFSKEILTDATSIIAKKLFGGNLEKKNKLKLKEILKSQRKNLEKKVKEVSFGSLLKNNIDVVKPIKTLPGEKTTHGLPTTEFQRTIVKTSKYIDNSSIRKESSQNPTTDSTTVVQKKIRKMDNLLSFPTTTIQNKTGSENEINSKEKSLNDNIIGANDSVTNVLRVRRSVRLANVSKSPTRRHATSGLTLVRSSKPGCQCPKSKSPEENQVLEIGTDCFNSVNDLLHLFVHVLGLDHQHNMHDRDDYLKVFWDKLSPEISEEMKAKLPPAASAGFPYDYQSVMHYPWLHIKNGVTQIMYPIWNDGWAMGHWQGLSATDVNKINTIYNKQCQQRKKLTLSFRPVG